ncbi:MAG: PAS domain S-box protein [Pyrinomonadaceae bacterium]
MKREGNVVGLANHTVLITKDGRKIPIEDSGAPIRDPDGKIIGVIAVFHDISDRRRADQEREELLRRERAARQEAEDADRLKDEFLATVSHGTAYTAQRNSGMVGDA